MQAPATTRMSSKGQVVIPGRVRSRLNLQPGTEFVVVAEDDVVILKTVRRVAMSDFSRLVREARRQAAVAGLRPSDIAGAVREARRRT